MRRNSDDNAPNYFSVLKLIDSSLRISAIALSVATIWLTVTNHQDNPSYGNLKFSNFTGLKYMVCISNISGVHAFLVALSSWITCFVTKAWLFFVSTRFEARTLCQAIRTSFICAIWAAVNKFWSLEFEIRRWVCPRGCELQLSLWLGPQKSKRRRLHGHGDSAVEERMESPGNGSRDLARGCPGLAVCLIVAYLMVTSWAAVMEILSLAYKGDKTVSWSEACTSYGKFCSRMKVALVLHALALCCFLVLAVISAYRVFSMFEPPSVSDKEVEEERT
ncbi:hypothetical protein ACFX2I_007342 [Malus domestica]|uniref:CASP-like protein n=1 Tax=Malus domestica TaxID=3750 RepID=A0A498IGX4_MALDO|nr:hypothetical protein DVH24_003356 [Malus domestica]